AFVGNPGYLALTLALASVAALGLLLTERRPLVRVPAAAVLLLCIGGLLVNQNLTSLSALAIGIVLLLFGLRGRRALLPILGLLLLLAAAVTVYRPTRERAAQAVAAVRARQWDRLTSYRLAPWAAAAVMASERPLLGFGPGTFEAEFVPHRLEAEIRLRRRLTNPLPTSSYAEAHCDYLQPFAETGAPAGLAALASAAALLAGLARAARGMPAPRRTEAILLLAFLGSGAAAALTWFPLQRPISAIPLLLAAGRAWRISRRAGDSDALAPEPPALEPERERATGWRRPAARLVRGLGLTLLLVWAFSPEIPRYRAERSLRLGSRALGFLLAHPADVADPPEALERILRLAIDAANDLPRDPRPRLLAGSARLVSGQPERALEHYRDALAAGEKAETDLNMARAYEALGRGEEARAAYLRAVWVSPALLPLLLPDVAEPLRAEVERLETELKAGRLKTPPARP
ncbi:MAG: O-antigen ligase family protein, partial [Thermoanaerobaculia bacterium]